MKNETRKTKLIAQIVAVIGVTMLSCPTLIAQKRKPELFVHTGHSYQVESVDISPDGKFLISSSMLEDSILWNISNGRGLRTFEGQHGLFSPDGTTLATAYVETTLWNWRTGQKLHTLPYTPSRSTIGLLSGFRGMVFSPDGKMLAVATADPVAVRLFDVATGSQLRIMAGHTDEIASMAFARDGRSLFTVSDDKTIKLWNCQTGRQIKTIPIETKIDSFSTIVFSPAGEFVAISNLLDQGINLLQLESGQTKLLQEDALSYSSSRLVFSPDGNTLADIGHRSKQKNGTLVDENRIILWSVRTGTIIRTLPSDVDKKEKDVEHNEAYRLLAFSPDGKTFAGRKGNKPILWDAFTGKDLRVFTGRAVRVLSFSLSASGDLLASAGSDNKIRLWKSSTGQQTQTLKGHASEITSMAFSTDGQRFASSDRDNIIKLWDVKSGQALKSLSAKNADTQEQVEELVPEFYNPRSYDIVSPNGKFRFTSLAPKVDIFDAANNKLLASIISLGESDWFVVTPDGLFDASSNELENPDGVHWLIPDDPLTPLSFEVFMRDYYEPSLLPRLLKCTEESNCDKEFKRVRNLTELNLTQPKVKITAVF